MRCSTGLETSKTASTSAIALLAIAKITMSWSVKSMGVPSDALLRGVLVPKCDGRSSEPAATWAFLPGVLKPLEGHGSGSNSLGSLLGRIRWLYVAFPTYAPQRSRRGGMYVLCLNMNVMNLVYC